MIETGWSVLSILTLKFLTNILLYVEEQYLVCKIQRFFFQLM